MVTWLYFIALVAEAIACFVLLAALVSPAYVTAMRLTVMQRVGRVILAWSILLIGTWSALDAYWLTLAGPDIRPEVLARTIGGALLLWGLILVRPRGFWTRLADGPQRLRRGVTRRPPHKRG